LHVNVLDLVDGSFDDQVCNAFQLGSHCNPITSVSYVVVPRCLKCVACATDFCLLNREGFDQEDRRLVKYLEQGINLNGVHISVVPLIIVTLLEFIELFV
jgi:hypothetical protein